MLTTAYRCQRPDSREAPFPGPPGSSSPEKHPPSDSVTMIALVGGGQVLRVISCSRSGEWRNWQTRRIQVPVSERMWGFKSPLAHPVVFTEVGVLVHRAPHSCLSRHSGAAVQPCCQIRFWKLRTPPKDTWSSETMSSPSILQCSAPAFSSAWCLSFAPGIGTTPLAITQFSATWLGVFPPCFSPTRRSSPTTPSTTPIGWFEKFRLPCGGRATEYLPVSRPWPIGE